MNHILSPDQTPASVAGKLLAVAMSICAILPVPVFAVAPVGGQISLATAPLANATTTTVQPNIMFTLDDSGSMAWNYLPDWADDNSPPDLLFNNAGFNGVYYNPAITYSVPVLYTAAGALDTTTYPSQTGQSTATGAGTGTTPNWKQVKDDGYGIQATGTSNLVGNASYYTFIAGEYCTDKTLTTCVAAAAATTTYPIPAYLRWCSDTALTNCRVLHSGSSYNNYRYPGMPSKTTIVFSGSSNTTLLSVTVNGKVITNAATATTNSTSTMAANLVTAINACTSAIAGNCTIAGYSASRSNSTVTITSPNGGGPITYTPSVSKTGSMSAATSAFSGGTPGSTVFVNIVSTTATYPYPGTSTAASSRTDCASTTCTYVEEMTNYANWWTYYQTRMQAMKTSVSRAFKALDNRYRVGFNTISYTGGADGTRYQHIDTFELAQKSTWYTKMFATNPTSSTPLRAALSKVGRIFAHTLSPSSVKDPLQYSCQQNFSILSTDGYWNTDLETSSYGPLGLSGSSSVGNLDGGATPAPMYEGSTAHPNTLADVAKYYYDTDLRTSALGNCTGAPVGSATVGNDVCENNVFTSTTDNNVQQHMTSFTMGLGADGTLQYTSDYLTDPNGDFAKIKAGVKFWPDPIANAEEERIDDLWHAAVNGQGTYFSAKDPDSIVRGFTSALASIASKAGAGSAAATSTLNPVAGNNFAYVASYTTVKWKGNLEARTINLNTGVVSEAATWCAEDVVPGVCTAPSAVVSSTNGGSTIYSCVTPNSTAATCGNGILSGGSCSVEIPKTCSGTMESKVTPLADTRVIKMNSGGGLVDFTYANLSTAQKAFFTGTNLSQWSTLDSVQQAKVGGSTGGVNFINYLRGQTAYDDRAANLVGPIDNRLYRFREAVLGDITESQPVYVGKPVFNYSDSGYSDFVTAQTSRAQTVFVGSNDGMLHAFDAVTGNERWAFVPTAVIPNMWKLADKNYSGLHTNYVNGPPLVADIYTGGAWKTILVGGLNGGGRSYYALDVTDPSNPSLLWELDINSDTDLKNLGYTFGTPVVTKQANGTWVVMLTSGYNNASSGSGDPSIGDGKGYLFIRNAATGAKIKTMSTGVGSTTVPSGLSKINSFTDNQMVNSLSVYVYGGDLLGNLWRFDINGSSNSPMLFAVLKDSSGVTQPITSRPELGEINHKRVIFVGTGKYLEVSDLVDTQQQSIYAIKDDNATATFNNPRTTLVQQTITTSGGTRTVSANPVDFTTGNGWYANFPDTGERVNIAPALDSGTLFVPTTVPSNTVCSPGGYGWFNYFNFKTGSTAIGAEAGLSGQKFNAPIVGLNIVYLPSGKRAIGVVTADNGTPNPPGKSPGDGASGQGFIGTRIIWRELIP